MSADNRKPELTLRINAKIPRRIPADEDAQRVAATFGLRGPRRSRWETICRDLRLTIAPGRIVAVVGPSGAGKSVLLAAAAERARRLARCGAVVPLNAAGPRHCEAPVVSAVGGRRPLAERLALLSRCGLAEAAVLVTPAKHLSGGQMYRLALARALAAAGRARCAGRLRLVVADEFASGLDGVTAWVLCRQVRKLMSTDGRRAGVALLVATPRAELLPALCPDELVIKPLGLPACVSRTDHGACDAPPGDAWPLRVDRGTIADYRALGRFHYVAGEPAAHKRVWVVHPPPGAAVGIAGPAAVMVISPPVARCRGRNAVMPRRYTTGGRAALARLNREIECISRVVVHPVFRGLGLAVTLVRHALATADTPMVEALAAMGGIHPMFEKAGMYAFGAFEGRRRYFYFLGRRMPYIV